jgi:enoyl-[acyl-carrier protein] reductase I
VGFRRWVSGFQKAGPSVVEQKPLLLAGCRGVVLGVSGENGMGFQAAQALRAFGADVALTCRPSRRAAVERLAAELGCSCVELDAMDETSFERAFQDIERSLGGLDFLVHTWVHVPDGVLRRPVYELTAEEFSDVMEVGVRSLLVACKQALPLLARSAHPRVVALVSSGADLAIPNYHVVGISKAALAATVRYLGQELGPRGVLCNSLNFSILATDAAQRAIGQQESAQTHGYLAKRSMTRVPLEFAHVTNTLGFLVSPLCTNLTGETLCVDGGFSRSYF